MLATVTLLIEFKKPIRNTNTYKHQTWHWQKKTRVSVMLNLEPPTSIWGAGATYLQQKRNHEDLIISVNY